MNITIGGLYSYDDKPVIVGGDNVKANEAEIFHIRAWNIPGLAFVVHQARLIPATREDWPDFDWPVWLSEVPHPESKKRVRIRTANGWHTVMVGSAEVTSFSLRSAAIGRAEDIRRGLKEEGYVDE